LANWHAAFVTERHVKALICVKWGRGAVARKLLAPAVN
jgi:hypothetical protein